MEGKNNSKLSQEKVLFQTNEIVLEYNLKEDTIYHRTKSITAIFGIPQKITNAQDYLIRYGVIQPESAKAFFEMVNLIKGGEPYAECIVRAKTATGDLLWIQIMLTAVYEGDEPSKAVGVFKDITQQRNVELQWNNDLRHRDIMMREAIIYYEADLSLGIVTYGLSKLLKSLKLSETDSYDEALAILVSNMVYPEERAAVRATFSKENLLEAYARGKRHVEMEYRRLTGVGTVMWVRGSAYLAENNISHHIVLFFCANDITDMKMRELSIRERTERDALTGLYNKVTAEMWIQEAIEVGEQRGSKGALLLISLHNYDTINAQMGRYFGDALLSELGHKLLKVCTPEDIAGRNAGVEFMIYLPNLTNDEEAYKKAERIYELICRDKWEVNLENRFSASIGIAMCPEHGLNYKEVYDNATIALHMSMQTGAMIVKYETDMEHLTKATNSIIEQQESSLTSFKDNMVEYVFRILYDSKDLSKSVQGVLALIADRLGFMRGYIYDIYEDGTAQRTYDYRIDDTLLETDVRYSLTPEMTIKCREIFYKNRIQIFKKEDLPNFANVLDEMTIRVLYGFKNNDRLSGFIGFDYSGKDDLSEEMIHSLKGVAQLLEVFLTGQSINQELGDSTQLLQSIVDGMHNFTYIIDPSTHIIKYVNRNTQQGLPDAVPGRKCFETLRNRKEVCEDCPIERMLKNNTTEDRSDMFLDPYGVWARINASMIRVSTGQVYGVFTGFDFSENRHETQYSEEDLRNFTLDTSLYDALSLSTDDYIIMCDMKTNLYYFPKKMVEEFDLSKQVIYDAIPEWLTHVHEDDKADFSSDITALLSGKSDTHNQEYRVQNKQGNWVWLSARGHVERNEMGEAITFVVVLTKLDKKNKVDHLTGLLDKYEFEVSIRSRLANDLKQGVLLLLGLDNFRYINNIYGWDFGDNVLKEAAVRMISILPDKFQLYRLDGDKFGIFFADCDLVEVKEYCQSLFQVFHQYRQFNGHRYYCTISGGCVAFHEQDVTFGQLYKQAIFALDSAKREGKNRLVVYDERTMSGNDRLLQIMAVLHDSVERGCKWFEVYYQPQIEPKTYRVKSAEALLRWKPPGLGMISPAEFIPLLEQTGLIHKVGRWVLQKAANVCEHWIKEIPDFTISVNLSYAQLQDQSFLPYLKERVEGNHINPAHLHLEITESCIADGSRSLKEALHELRGMGFKIEMDDFGTGYSSLEILKNAPPDVVKIDHAFVKDITHSNFDATFIKFIVTLCHSVNICVCLEGVENWDEYELVEPMDLDLIQGFLFGKPQPKESFEKTFLKNLQKE